MDEHATRPARAPGSRSRFSQANGRVLREEMREVVHPPKCISWPCSVRPRGTAMMPAFGTSTSRGMPLSRNALACRTLSEIGHLETDAGEGPRASLRGPSRGSCARLWRLSFGAAREDDALALRDELLRGGEAHAGVGARDEDGTLGGPSPRRQPRPRLQPRARAPGGSATESGNPRWWRRRRRGPRGGEARTRARQTRRRARATTW